MKSVIRFAHAFAISATISLMAGCDWSSSGTSLNTSQGAGVNVNFSGVYDGNLAGGKAVDKPSRGNILRMVISQSGNRVQVVDNQGSRYEGTVGSPGLISQPDSNGAYPVGAELVQAQISFSGKDEVAGRNIQFVGVIHAVAIEDVKGTTTTKTSGSSQTNVSSNVSGDIKTGKTTQTINNGVNTTIIEELIVGVPGEVGFYQKTTTTTTIKNETGETLSRDVKTEKLQSNISTKEQSTATVSTTKFTITEANTQYRLEGNWIEEGGNASSVDALSPGTAGVITTTTESANTAPTPTAQVTFFN